MRLKRCPFCGNRAYIIDHKLLDETRGYSVHCKNPLCCGAIGEYIFDGTKTIIGCFKTEKEAGAAWNHREQGGWL